MGAAGETTDIPALDTAWLLQQHANRIMSFMINQSKFNTVPIKIKLLMKINSSLSTSCRYLFNPYLHTIGAYT